MLRSTKRYIAYAMLFPASFLIWFMCTHMFLFVVGAFLPADDKLDALALCISAMVTIAVIASAGLHISEKWGGGV